MPRHVEPIIIKDTDAVYLASILAGSTPAGEDIVKRAKVLSLLSEGKQIKDVAKAVGMRENTVTDLRRRYLSDGMDCLQDRSRSGRPAKYASKKEVAGKIDSCIHSLEEALGRAPSVKEVTESLRGAGILASPEIVRPLMQERGLVQERKRTWEFLTDDGMDASIIEVVGMYLSHDQQLLAVKISKSGELPRDKGQGKVIAFNSSVAAAIEGSEEEASYAELTHMLSVFTEAGISSKSGKKIDALSFVQSVIGENSPSDNEVIHLLACGAPIISNDRQVLTGAILEVADSLDLWLAKTENLLNLVCTGHDPRIPVNLMNGMERYLGRAGEQSIPFMWKKTPASASCFRDSREDSDRIQDYSTVAPGTIQFTGKIMGDNGEWITFQMQGDMKMTQGAFGMGSAGEYLTAASVIEQAIADISHETAKGLNQKYLTETAVKKNG